MDIKEIREEKDKLEIHIENLIKAYEQKTGTKVSSIEYTAVPSIKMVGGFAPSQITWQKKAFVHQTI